MSLKHRIEKLLRVIPDPDTPVSRVVYLPVKDPYPDGSPPGPWDRPVGVCPDPHVPGLVVVVYDPERPELTPPEFRRPEHR